MTEHKFNKSIVNSIMQTLNESLKKDQTLAQDLLQFLKDRNIKLPNISKKEMEKILPVSFSKKNSNEQMDKLKNSFIENDLKENIL